MTLSPTEIILLLDSADVARDDLVMLAEASGESWCRTRYKDGIWGLDLLISKLVRALEEQEA